MKTQKENIIDLVMELENSNLLNKLESLLFQYQFEKQSSTQMSEDEIISELKMALKDVQEKKVSTISELKEEVKSWK